MITGCNPEAIKRWMKEDGIIRAVQLRARHVDPPPDHKKGKYDHLIWEPKCQGKDYKDYVKHANENK